MKRWRDFAARLLKAWGREGNRAWQKFWFETPADDVLPVFRSCLGFLLFAFYAIRSLDLRWLFSENGFLSLEAIRETMPMEGRYSLFALFPSDGFLLFGNAVFLLSLLALGFGILPRISAVVALVFHVSFLHRNMAIPYGIDLIATYFLFALAIAWTRDLRSVALRFVQLQVCVIYAYSGWDKLKGASWWTGEALWGVLANVQLARMDFTFLSGFPAVLATATYLTLFWEIYFGILIWLPKWRRPILIFGVLFHIGIALTIHIAFFAGIMITGYLAFLAPEEAQKLRRFLARRLSTR